MLELKDVCFCASGRKILRDFSMDVAAGELVVITGPNGSGKSTLAELMMGIKKLSSGKIVFDGQDVTEKGIAERAKMGMAFSFQKPVEFKGIRVQDLLEIAVYGKATGENIAECKKMLVRVGLDPEEYLTREVDSSLSGGELKRIEIASVIARKAKFTIFDEPEAGIDIWSFDNLVKAFKTMQKNIRDSSIVVISHQKQLMRIADRIIVLKNGRIDYQGSAEEVLAQIEGPK